MNAAICYLTCPLLLLLSSATNAATNISVPIPNGYQTVGNGKLSWWGITIYHATLHSVDGIYHPQRDHALQINYRINVTAQKLAEVSLDEIEAIYGPQPQRKAMVQRLSAVFCDVKKGDSILGHHQPGKGATFYCNDHLSGTLDAPELADAFFAIWLHPDSSEPQLRTQLIGVKSQ